MTTNINRAVASWQDQGLELLPGIDRAHMAELAKAFIFDLSADVQFLYSLCGGMAENVDDQSLFALWPLERALRESARFPKGLLPFAEGMLSSHLYLLRRETDEFASVYVDYWYSGQQIECVAESLDTALLYLTANPGKLHLPQ